MFTTTCSDWREGTYENFKLWASTQFGLKESESDDEAEVPVNFQKAKDISFDRNKRGKLILPPMSNYRTIKQRQRVIRGYVGALYSMLLNFATFLFLKQLTGDFTGNSRASFPFTLAATEDQTIYSPDSVPEGFTLKDPDHTTAPNINALYTHWIARQRKGLVPLVILNAGPLHAHLVKKSAKVKGKKKMEYVEVDTEDDGLQDEVDRGNTPDGGEGESGEELPVPKIGPPTGKGRNRRVEDRNQVAGPSEKPPLKPKRKEKKKGEKATVEESGLEETAQQKKKNKVNYKKRDAEDELLSAVPPKVQKTHPVRKSARAGTNPELENSRKVSSFLTIRLRLTNLSQNGRGLKRLPEEDLGPKPKRSRKSKDADLFVSFLLLYIYLIISRFSAIQKEESSPQRETRGRVKAFPAGNVATSSSRTAFLRSLCSLPKFSTLADFIQPVVKFQIHLAQSLFELFFFSLNLQKFQVVTPLGLLGVVMKYICRLASTLPNLLTVPWPWQEKISKIL